MVLPWQCILLIVTLPNSCIGFGTNMSAIMKQRLGLQVKDMFLHAYHSYKLFNELEEFEEAVKAVISTVKFDSDIDVSVFETNIRVLGGLLGGHVSALALKKNNQSKMTWYTDQLLHMSVDIANRLLPAFETPTGMPLPRVNLRHGVSGLAKNENHTCTACAGTMILEFATLSRLTGLSVFEEKAALGLAYLWKQRNRNSDLVGHVIDVHSGEWIRKESGIGAGFDSYYEYLLKAYVLFGESVYLHRFNTHYEAIKRYVSGPESAEFPFLFLNVLMHRPAQRSRAFMDALFAFWPGLQVLTGDVKSAVASHEFLFQVNKRNTFLPEAFTVDFNVHWAEYLLRPEFIESTYLLHHATGDPYYLAVGEQLVQNLQQYARVPCGFAAIKDVRTMKLLDRLDSFVLAETFKYLYLLFADPKDLPISLDEYVFSTEAHILPLGLPKVSSGRYTTNFSGQRPSEVTLLDYHGDRDHATEAWLGKRVQCPAVAYLHNPRRHQPCLADNLTGQEKCNIWQGTSLQRGRLFWLKFTDPNHLELICPFPSLQPIPPHSQSTLDDHTGKNGLWSLIDVIRRPLRQLAVHFGLSPSTSTGDNNSGKVNNAQGDADLGMFEIDGAVPLRAANARLNDATHLAIIRRMGIEIIVGDAGRMSIRHDQSLVRLHPGCSCISPLVKCLIHHSTKVPDPPPQSWFVVLLNPPHFGRTRLPSCPAHFAQFPGEFTPPLVASVPLPLSANRPSGTSSDRPSCSDELTDCDNRPGERTPVHWRPLIGQVRVAQPLDACSPLGTNAAAYPARSLDWSGFSDTGKPVAVATDDAVSADEEQQMANSAGSPAGSIALVRRGGCLFIEKARNLLAAGAIGGIIVDLGNESSATRTPIFTMSGETENDRQLLPLAFTMLFAEERDQLLAEMRRNWELLRRPAVIMLTKQATPTQTFSSSLQTLLIHKLGQSVSQESDQPVVLVSRLTSLPSTTTTNCETVWFFVTPSLLFTVSHLPVGGTDSRACYHGNQYWYHHPNPSVCSATGNRKQWFLTVRVSEEDKQKYLHQLDFPGSAGGVVSSWLSLLNRVVNSSQCW